MGVRTQRDVFNFRGKFVPAVLASVVDGPWTRTVTGAGGPTILGVNDGGAALALEATSQIQNLCLSFGDILAYNIDDLVRFEALVKITGGLDSSTTAVIGMASARNDDPDAIAAAALFKLDGSNTLVVETDDGVNNNDDISTGDETLTAVYKRLVIDFATGVRAVSPPSGSLGGKGNVLFQAANANGSLRRVAHNTAFNMENYSGGLQPYFQIQKTADTNVDVLTPLQCVVEYKLPN